MVIEIVGDSHIGKEIMDKERQSMIEKYGINFLRFPDNEVKNNLNGVMKAIIDWIEKNGSLIYPNNPFYPPLLRGNNHVQTLRVMDSKSRSTLL